MSGIVNASIDNGADILTDGDTASSAQVIAIAVSSAVLGLLLIVIVVGIIVYKQTRRRRSSAGGAAGISDPAASCETSSSIVKDSSTLNNLNQDEDHRWKAEDNPHNQWRKLSFSEEADDRDKTNAELHKKQLLRKGSVSE